MAKKKTLRKQRDKALKELSDIKKVLAARHIDSAMQAHLFYERVAILQAFYDYNEAEMRFPIDPKDISRRLLHQLVDAGHFDQAVVSSTLPGIIGCKRHVIEIRVLKTETQSTSIAHDGTTRNYKLWKQKN